MPDVFISYSSTDRDWVKKLANGLEEFGLDVWWDPKINPGQAYREIIQNALDNANCVIVVWSQESIKSMWVQDEATQAIQRGILIPVLHENVRIPMPFNSLQTANLQSWDEDILDEKFKKLIAGVEIHCGILPHYKNIRKNNEILPEVHKRTKVPASEHNKDKNEGNNKYSFFMLVSLAVISILVVSYIFM